MHRLRWVGIGLSTTLLASAALAELAVTARIDPKVMSSAFSGRVVVYFGKGNDPRNGPNWFNPEPCLSVKVTGLKPGDPVRLVPSRSVTFPKKFVIAPGKWKAQVVFDRNLGGRAIGSSPGNIYSKSIEVDITESGGSFELLATEVVGERTFRETEVVKEVAIESKLLSKHYGRPTVIRAAVVLPDEFSQDLKRKFPVIYSIPGFGGSHWGMSGRTSNGSTRQDGEPFIYVYLNPDCPTGHSVFADSANNGPWGKALTTELIPAIESRFRAYAIPEARFVTGHSSGGWSSFWLQVAYPDFFGGCWSTAPDPVDFRSFQYIDIYAKNANAFVDEKGQKRPIARMGGRASVFYEPFSDMERPIRGEQLGSFHAVFGPKGKDGEPVPLWDLITGNVNPKVADAWRKYDISSLLRMQSKKLVPKLKGKIHVYMGDMDTFYLEGAVKLLKADIDKMGNPYKAVIEIVPGDHGSMMTPQLRQQIAKDMAETWRQSKAKLKL